MIEIPIILCLNTSRILSYKDSLKVGEKLKEFSGPCICIVTFPKEEKGFIGVQMHEKVRFCNELKDIFGDLDFIEKVNWGKVEISSNYPNLDKYYDKDISTLNND